MKVTKELLKMMIKEELTNEVVPYKEPDTLPITLHGEAQDGAKYSLTITKFQVFDGQTQDDEYFQTAISELEKALAGKMTIG